MTPPSRPPASHPRGVSAQLDRFVHDRLPPPELRPTLRYDLPELQFPAQLNLVEALLDKAPAKGFGQRPLLRSSRVTFSYEEVAERVNRIAQWLTEDMGLVPGNRVLLRGGNSIGMALCWLAVVKAGMVAVATMPLLRARELGDIIEKAQPVLALCDATLLAELKYAQREHPVLRTIQKFNAPDDPDDLAAQITSDPIQTEFGPLLLIEEKKISLNQIAIAAGYAQKERVAYSPQKRAYFRYNEAEGIWGEQSQQEAIRGVTGFLKQIQKRIQDGQLYSAAI